MNKLNYSGTPHQHHKSKYTHKHTHTCTHTNFPSVQKTPGQTWSLTGVLEYPTRIQGSSMWALLPAMHLTPAPHPQKQAESPQTNKKQCSRQLQCKVPFASDVVNSSLFIKFFFFLLVFHQSCYQQGGIWWGEGGPAGEGEGRALGGGGRGHFMHPAIYCTTTWCFALNGLRTTRTHPPVDTRACVTTNAA